MTGERSMFLDLNLVEGGTISFGGIGMGNITGIGKIDIPSLASMKEQMTTMMEAMMDMRKIMEVNATAAATANTTTKRDLTHPPIFNQESHLVSDVGGQGGVAGVVAYGPQYTQSHNRYIFPPYGLPPNYTPPMVVSVPIENVTNLIPVCTENHQTQPDQTQAYNSNAMEEAQEAPIDHTITGFKPHPGYIAEGHAFSGVLVLNTLGASQYRLLSQPLHFMRGEGAPAVFEKEKIEHIEERLRAIEGGGSYGFADMLELCLVPDVTIPPKFKVPDFDKYKGTACPKNHLRMYYKRMRAYAKDEKLLMHFFFGKLGWGGYYLVY